MKGLLAKLGASALLMGVAIWWVDGSEVWENLRGLSPVWLLVSGLALTLATASMARRWQVVAGHLGLSLSYGTALREYYLGAFINQTVPGGVTGDVARAFRARQTVDLKTAALSVALERLLGQIFIFTLLAFGLIVALVTPGGIAWGGWAWSIPLALALAVGVLPLLARQSGTLGRFCALLLALQRRPELVLHATLTCGCLLLSFYASARAAGTVIPPAGWATVIPLILIAMLIPLSIGGWGWREGAAAGLFPLLGEAPSAGVAAGIAYGGMVLVAALPATLILLMPKQQHLRETRH